MEGQVGPATQKRRLQKLAELLGRQTRIADDAAHRDRVHGIVTRNSQNARPIAHDDVLALTKNDEAGLFEGAHGIEVIDSRQFGQG